MLTLLFTSIFTTISVIEDRHHGFLQAVLAAPVSRISLVLGKTLGGVAIASSAGRVPALAGAAGRLRPAPSMLAADRRVMLLGGARLHLAGFAMAWWLDSTQGYHVVMSVLADPALDPLGRDVPAHGQQPLAGDADRAQSDDLRRVGASAAASTAPPCPST